MFEDLTLFAMAQKSMDYLSRRQAVLSENVANANTPNFKSKDLAPLEFKDLMQPAAQTLRAVSTNPMHISPDAEPTRFQEISEHRPTESKPNGNQVQVEDQMQKIGLVKGNYELAVNLMMKHIAMLKIALDSNAPSV
jgi:flagellar basal-body rod protein FlgB